MSQVLRTVLIVGITVIFSSMSAALIFGSLSDPEMMRVLCISGHANPDGTAAFTYRGGGDLNGIEDITVRYADGTSEVLFGSTPAPGDSATTSRVVTGERVILVGSFGADTDQILYDGQF